MFRPRLSVLLSFNAGYVDTMGFLALAGLLRRTLPATL